MNVHEKAVLWFKENATIEGTPQELEFMRKKAETVHQCSICEEYQKPFWHIFAAATSNGKNSHLSEKIPMEDPFFSLDARLWVHVSDLVSKWSSELEGTSVANLDSVE